VDFLTDAPKHYRLLLISTRALNGNNNSGEKDRHMAGTAKGGRLAAEKNKKKHGSDFYSRIGKLGGQRGRTGGFAAGEEGRKRASEFGAIGGSISRRSN
jgi:hypothetical protein